MDPNKRSHANASLHRCPEARYSLKLLFKKKERKGERERKQERTGINWSYRKYTSYVLRLYLPCGDRNV